MKFVSKLVNIFKACCFTFLICNAIIQNSFATDITPQVNKVCKNSNGTYTATWGYLSHFDPGGVPQSKTIAAGTSSGNELNYFIPDPKARPSQPSTFLYGQQSNVFTTVFTVKDEWIIQVRLSNGTIYNRRATANPSTTLCTTATPTPTSTATKTATATSTATRTNTATPTMTSTATPTATSTATATLTVTSTPTVTNTPTPLPTINICHIPNGDTSMATTISILISDLNTHLAHNDVQGPCPNDCMGIPFGQAVVDLCGVCGGDNSTCKDCAGVPNGSAKIDVCGKCDGDGKSCLGCDGQPNSGKVVDACNVCGGDNSSCKDCLGIPNGGAQIDLCGQCNGNSSSCLDCSGVPNGTKRIDNCGVCGGDSSTCVTITCDGVVDACGVCNGSNACLDCAGIPNGGTKIDCCGVCGGDGSSCPELCTVYNLAKEKSQLKKSIMSLLKTIRKYSLQDFKCSKSKSATSRIKSAQLLSQQTIDLYSEFVEDKVKFCNTIFCTKSSLVDVNQNAKSNIKKLFKLSKTSQYAAGKSCKSGPRPGNRLNSQSSLDLQKGLYGISKVPNLKCVN